MSRVGKLAVEVPSGVNVAINGTAVEIQGPLGKLSRTFRPLVKIVKDGNKISVNPIDDSKEARTMWGTARAVINNMVQGVSKGYTRELEVQGVGFRANLEKDNILGITLGFSHEIKYVYPAGVKITVDKQTALTITGPDKEVVGQVASEIRSFRKPEPYKGKGVRYKGEQIRMKEGKKK